MTRPERVRADIDIGNRARSSDDTAEYIETTSKAVMKKSDGINHIAKKIGALPTWDRMVRGMEIPSSTQGTVIHDTQDLGSEYDAPPSSQPRHISSEPEEDLDDKIMSDDASISGMDHIDFQLRTSNIPGRSSTQTTPRHMVKAKLQKMTEQEIRKAQKAVAAYARELPFWSETRCSAEEASMFAEDVFEFAKACNFGTFQANLEAMKAMGAWKAQLGFSIDTARDTEDKLEEALKAMEEAKASIEGKRKRKRKRKRNGNGIVQGEVVLATNAKDATKETKAKESVSKSSAEENKAQSKAERDAKIFGGATEAIANGSGPALQNPQTFYEQEGDTPPNREAKRRKAHHPLSTVSKSPEALPKYLPSQDLANGGGISSMGVSSSLQPPGHRKKDQINASKEIKTSEDIKEARKIKKLKKVVKKAGPKTSEYFATSKAAKPSPFSADVSQPANTTERSLEDTTKQFPDAVEAIAKQAKEAAEQALAGVGQCVSKDNIQSANQKKRNRKKRNRNNNRLPEMEITQNLKLAMQNQRVFDVLPTQVEEIEKKASSKRPRTRKPNQDRVHNEPEEQVIQKSEVAVKPQRNSSAMPVQTHQTDSMINKPKRTRKSRMEQIHDEIRDAALNDHNGERVPSADAKEQASTADMVMSPAGIKTVGSKNPRKRKEKRNRRESKTQHEVSEEVANELAPSVVAPAFDSNTEVVTSSKKRRRDRGKRQNISNGADEDALMGHASAEILGVVPKIDTYSSTGGKRRRSGKSTDVDVEMGIEDAETAVKASHS